MKPLSKYSFVSILVPSNVQTGGVALLHQLAHEINIRGGRAGICYIPSIAGEHIIEEYKKYKFHTIHEPLDLSGAIIVIPEVFARELFKIRRAETAFWWLSVDAFFGGATASRKRKVFSWVVFACMIILKWRTIHLYQSDYARAFLERFFVRSCMPLFDYIEDCHLSSDVGQTREPTIAYNPKKGFNYTKILMDHLPDCVFLPLHGLTPEQMKTALATSTIYIDFGHHPGKDRIPREATLAGAVVVVGKRGSACNAVDIPLEGAYKIDLRKDFPCNAIRLIRDITKNYELHYERQRFYRLRIGIEKSEFENQVQDIFFTFKP